MACTTRTLTKRRTSPSYSSSSDIGDQQDLCPARISGRPPVFGCLGPPDAYDKSHSSWINFISSLSGYLSDYSSHTYSYKYTSSCPFVLLLFSAKIPKKYGKHRLCKIVGSYLKLVYFTFLGRLTFHNIIIS